MEQYGLIDKIVKAIGPDYSRFQTVLNMTIEDMLTNERSLLARLDSLKESVLVMLDEVGESMEKMQKELPNEGK